MLSTKTLRKRCTCTTMCLDGKASDRIQTMKLADISDADKLIERLDETFVVFDRRCNVSTGRLTLVSPLATRFLSGLGTGAIK